MTTCPTQLEYRRLRVPRENRSVLIDPPLHGAGRLADENVRLRNEHGRYDCQGRSLGSLISQARDELIREALSYSAAYRDVERPPEGSSPRIFLAGHQPQLFHPGVWLKNFALGHLASRCGAVAVNLTVDSDTCKQTALKVPSGSATEPQSEQFLFDRPGPSVPYEQRRIEDRETFSDFGHRVAERIAPLVPEPLIADYWPLVQRRAEATNNLGACLAQARHQLEGQWGSQTLELPQSRICRGESFCWFAAHLMAQATRLRRVYNEAVAEYRRVHRIRSHAHPVPDLERDGDWVEVPLWVYSNDDPRRRRLFVRRVGTSMRLSDREELEIDLPLSPDGDATRAVQQLVDIADRGVKIRSRALITTLWARLALGDLFLHGIGGAKYDQVTDLLVRRFFGLVPPRFVVLSATLHLPIKGTPPAGSPQQSPIEEARSIGQQLRQLDYHPESHINGQDTTSAGLIAEKRRWVETSQTPQNARTRCRAIRRVNASLQPWVASRREDLLRGQVEAVEAMRVEEILAWREYGFCLHPEQALRAFFSTIFS